MHTDAVYPCAFCTFNKFVFPEYLCSRNIRAPEIRIPKKGLLMFSTILEQMMRAIADAARIPVIIALFCFLAFSLFSIGMTAMEAWGERRYLDYHLPGLLEELQDCKPNRVRARIKGSGLLTRHKDILLELASHPSFGQDMLESLADNLMEKEQAHYDHILSMTALTARLAPMAGLLGTLIPLGPGITALGSGDVQTLSRSLLIAFDTTVLGLIASGICLVTGSIRRRWYAQYMSDLQTLADCVVDKCRSRQESPKDTEDSE